MLRLIAVTGFALIICNIVAGHDAHAACPAQRYGNRVAVGCGMGKDKNQRCVHRTNEPAMPPRRAQVRPLAQRRLRLYE